MNFLVTVIVSWLYLLGRGLLYTAIHSYVVWDIKTDQIKDIAKYYFQNGPVVQEFDFIIVGAGSAGATAANRLSAHFNVLLLETGGEQNPLSYIPLMHVTLQNDPDLDYAYKTKPQTASCLSLKNQQSIWNRGKSLGGSSSLNAYIIYTNPPLQRMLMSRFSTRIFCPGRMGYLRGHPKDYDNWAKITGDERWNYSSIFPFFLKSEDYCVECEPSLNDPTFNPLFHHTDGYLSVSKPPVMNLVEEFLQASEWSGVPRVDLNGPYLEGASAFPHNYRFGRRCSTNTAFLDTSRYRKTLTISKFSIAYKILFRGDTNEAYGIEYEKHGRRRIALARKEVILSAGAIETPKLLMLSGIGPKEHLQTMGIPTRVDLPAVGKNVQDHISVLISFAINETNVILSRNLISLKTITDFVFKGRGLLTSSGMQAVSFHTSPTAQQAGEINWPDTQYTYLSYGIDKILPDLVRLDKFGNLDRNVAQYFEQFKGKEGFQILIYVSRPSSRGEILLRSPDYRDDPIPDPQYYLDPESRDIKATVEGIKKALYLCEHSPSYTKLGCQAPQKPFRPCIMFPFRSDDYWACYSRHVSITIWHYVGTAAMGKPDSPKAVVDSELRVLGTKNLRVIDASVMPNIVSVNPNGAAIVIGERGAQFVIDQWKSK